MVIKKDVVSVGVLAVFALANQFWLIPEQVIAQGSSDEYPKLLNGALIFFIVCYALEILRARSIGKKLSVWKTDVRELGKIAVLLVGIVIWGVCMEYGGFILPTGGLLAFSIWLYGEKQRVKILLVALFTPFALYLFFMLLGSALPQGPLEHSLSGLF